MYAGIRLNCRVFVNALCSTQQEMAVRVLPLYNKKSSAKALNLGGTTEQTASSLVLGRGCFCKIYNLGFIGFTCCLEKC